MANNKKPTGTELVQLAGKEYQKTPVSFVENVVGSLNLPQMRIFLGIIEAAQEKIGKYYDNRDKGNVVADTLFDMEDFDPDNRDVKTFDIKLGDLTEHACDYGDVRKACFALENILVHVTKKIHGKESESNIQLCNVWTPKSKRAGFISIQFRKEILDIIMNLRHGYIKSLKNITDVVRRDRTTNVYMYLSSEFRMKNEFEIPYKELRETLRIEGKRQKEVDGKKIIEDYCYYKEYRDFKRRVLNDTKEDMDNLLRTGQMEFSFEFDEIRKKDRKKGEPIAIRFRIVTVKKLQEKEEAIAEAVIVETRANLTEPWEQLATLACQEHQRWWETFGTKDCALPSEIKDDSLWLYVVSDFIIEKWNEEASWLLPLVQKCFNVQRIDFKIEPKMFS